MLTNLLLNIRVLGVNRRPLKISGAALVAGAIYLVFLRVITPPAYATNMLNWPLADLLPISAVALWLCSAMLVPVIIGVLSARITLRTYFSEAHALLSLETSPLDRVLAFVGLCLYRLQGLLVVIILAMAVTIEDFVLQMERRGCIPEDFYCNSPLGSIQIASLLGAWCVALSFLAAAIGVYYGFRMKSAEAYLPAGLISLLAGVLASGLYCVFLWGRRPQVVPESMGVAVTFLLAAYAMNATKAWTWTRKIPQGVRHSEDVAQVRY